MYLVPHVCMYTTNMLDIVLRGKRTETACGMTEELGCGSCGAVGDVRLRNCLYPPFIALISTNSDVVSTNHWCHGLPM